MSTEEPFITIDQLLKRWRGMDYDEIGRKLTERAEAKKGKRAEDLFAVPFPQPYRIIGLVRTNPSTGGKDWEPKPIDSSPYSWDDFNREARYDLDGYVFMASDVKAYEEENPKMGWSIAGDPDDPEELVEYESISAEEAYRQLKMSPGGFIRHLRGHVRDALLLEGLTPDERDEFYGPEDFLSGRGTIPRAASLLPKILINRLDWENHLKTLAGVAETTEPGAGEEALKARLAEIMAEGRAKQKQLEAELAREREARVQAEKTANVKSTDKATIGRLGKQLEAWKGAPAWMIPAALAVAQEGPKPRTRTELWPFVIDAGGPQKRSDENEQFKAWRAALPDDLCDKRAKNDPSNNPPVDDEPVDG